jgi:hypothetical protein
MTQADSVHSTPPTNSPISQVDATSRRRFLSNAAGIAAGGTALALAIPPVPAVAGPTIPLDPGNASPALRAAALALDDAHERLKEARAAFDAADLLPEAWRRANPERPGDARSKGGSVANMSIAIPSRCRRGRR